MGIHTIYKSEEGKREILNHYEAYLLLTEIQFERIYVETRFGKTHVLVTGPTEGKPLFILQGGNCINPMTLTWFTPLLKEYRVYAPDTVGHPGYSAETRVSAKDESFGSWISDLMDHFNIPKCACIGPSYGGGIILRLAAFMPQKINCSVLMSPSGLSLGSTIDMIQKILIPMLLFNWNASPNQLQKIADVMSLKSMKEIDKEIIGGIFKHVKLEQNMPKLTEKKELVNYSAPTLVLAGTQDIFFPSDKVIKKAAQIISNATMITYEMGHFPAEERLLKVNKDIQAFLAVNY
ncbi:alpha/beta hydrolase [Paenibacillaceae bacterium]|nr:alpha/beta hydrolase [Paenibacillaceae bacterium]